MMDDSHDVDSYIGQEEEEEVEEFTSSGIELEEGQDSRRYLRFNQRTGGTVGGETGSRAEGMESERAEGEEDEGEGEEEEETEEEMSEMDSLANASEEEVVGRALEILGLDPDGRLLPLSSDQEVLLDSLWTKAGITDLPTNHPSASATTNKPLDPLSSLSPHWIRNLNHSVLFVPPADPLEEGKLVHAIKKNLNNIVNNLSEDQWRYPPPPSFLPTSTSMAGKQETNESGRLWMEGEHEGYLEREFNPLSLGSSVLVDSESIDHPAQPPRQLWMGEDEDEGLDSDASLRDLLNPSPALPDSSTHHHSPLLSSLWPRSRPPRSASRHAQSSSLAKQVSRLGMAE